LEDSAANDRGVNLIVAEMECTERIEGVLQDADMKFKAKQIAGIYRVYSLEKETISL